MLTSSSIKGATNPPILAHMEATPRALFLTTVGKVSAVKGYMVQYATEMNSLPTMDSATRTSCRSGGGKGRTPESPVSGRTSSSPLEMGRGEGPQRLAIQGPWRGWLGRGSCRPNQAKYCQSSQTSQAKCWLTSLTTHSNLVCWHWGWC